MLNIPRIKDFPSPVDTYPIWFSNIILSVLLSKPKSLNSIAAWIVCILNVNWIDFLILHAAHIIPNISISNYF